jgi:hypothetical protein
MRIRTIKPEFWSHPVIGLLDDADKLLAIGLLNLADDEGYFLAHPTLVRNALRPFDEDSTKTRRALETLSKVGWIEVREHSEQGQIGKVVNFTKHQRIDRPTASKIATYFDSTSPRRALDEPSLLERKGKEQGKEGNRDIALPTKRERFVPPSREELNAKANELGLPDTQVDAFVDFYGSKGWIVGKAPMRSWQHALSGWTRRWKERTPNGKHAPTQIPLWRQEQLLEETLRSHPGNPESIANARGCTDADREDYKAKKAKLREIKAQLNGVTA